MLSKNKLWELAKTKGQITKEDLGIDRSHDCPYEHDCNKCNGKFCKRMYFVNKNGLTIFNPRLRGGK